jgi:hypothetical protein
MATVNLFGDLALDNSVQETNDKIDAITVARDSAMSSTQKGVAAMAVRRDADAVGVADGNTVPLAVDEEGRLKTTNKLSNFASVSGIINSVGAALVVDVRYASNIVLHLKNTGTATMAAGTFLFEGSIDSTDGTNGTWFSIQAVRSNANTVESFVATTGLTAGTGLTYSHEASVNAYQYARVRTSVAATASSNAMWTVQRGSYATEPIPAIQLTATQAVSGTVTANQGTLNAGSAAGITTTATTNATSAKTTAGTIYEVTVSNPTATPVYVKFYSKASAPTVGTDVPAFTIPVPATGANAGFVSYSFGTIGKRMSAGIAYAVTGAAATSDTTAAVAGVQVHFTYI